MLPAFAGTIAGLAAAKFGIELIARLLAHQLLTSTDLLRMTALTQREARLSATGPYAFLDSLGEVAVYS